MCREGVSWVFTRAGNKIKITSSLGEIRSCIFNYNEIANQYAKVNVLSSAVVQYHQIDELLFLHC
jgi:hypothetical protein